MISIQLDENVAMPRHAKDGDAGVDLASKEEVKILAGAIGTVHTGVRVEIPEGFVGLIVPRSSTGKLGLRLSNTVGVIDSGYRGEIMCKLLNCTDFDITVKQSQGVVQLLIVPYVHMDFRRVDKVSETERGEGGFGSTG